MTVQVEREIPFDLKKHLKQFPEKINSSYLSSLPSDEVGTWLLFADGSKRDSDVSYITHDIFDEMSLEAITLNKIATSKKKLSQFLKTMEILCDKKFMKQIKQGLKEINEGKLISEEEFFKKHNLK